MDKRSYVILLAFLTITVGAVFALYEKYMVRESIVFLTEGFTLEEEE